MAYENICSMWYVTPPFSQVVRSVHKCPVSELRGPWNSVEDDSVEFDCFVFEVDDSGIGKYTPTLCWVLLKTEVMITRYHYLVDVA